MPSKVDKPAPRSDKYKLSRLNTTPRLAKGAYEHPFGYSDVCLDFKVADYRGEIEVKAIN